MSRIIAAARTASGVTEFSEAFLKAEWDAVVDPFGLRSWDEYRNAPRARRGTALGARQKLRVWGALERVHQQLEDWGLMTWNGLCLGVARALDTRILRPYQHLLVDECQDLGPAELILARSLVGAGPDDLFLAGDAGQRIFRNRFSWLSVGIEVRGRSSRLKVNYRTTEAIQRFADLLQPVTESGGAEPELRDAISLLTGPEPEIAGCNNVAEEIQAICKWIAKLLKDDLQPAEIAIFARSEALLKARALPAVQACGLQYGFLKDDMQSIDRVILGTMHRAKGLEFKAVGVIGCDLDLLPMRSVTDLIEDAGDREGFMEQERNLLYVACSRARERLLVSYTGEPSQFLARARQVSH